MSAVWQTNPEIDITLNKKGRPQSVTTFFSYNKLIINQKLLIATQQDIDSTRHQIR